MAQENPERIAIIDGQTRINYQALLQRAGEISGGLKNHNFKPGALIGVCMQRSWELVATLLGVMKAGYTYVPLDPTYPKDRVHYILEHSKASAVIVDNEISANLCGGAGKLMWLNEMSGDTDSAIKASPRDLAYVIYTSGSTGNPKGVAIEHRSIVAMCSSMHELFTREELSGVLAAASICFDTSVMEIFGTLSLGGTIILAENALELTTLPARNQVRTCVMVASSVQAILSTDKLPEELICLVFGGEALKRSLVEQVYRLKPGLRVFNAYGPTEDTVYSTMAELSVDTNLITIGKSVTNSRAYILDDAMQSVAVGLAGELYLAGNKLARGYLNDDALTKERFIEKEPNDQIPDSRLYRTGDLCRWTSNGEIEFLGRVDQQVKIRGFRIELEEIESTLESMQEIDTAAAAAVDGGIGQKLLAVFVVSRKQTVDEARVKSFVSKRLPSYMVPQVVKQLNELPLLPNDKLDCKKLMTYYNASVESKYTNGSTPNFNRGDGGLKTYNNSIPTDKATILSIIRSELVSILNIGDSSIVLSEDSFSNLGLDSLSTLEFSSRLSKLLKKEVPANAIFKKPTPIALANYIINTDGVEENECSTAKPSRIVVDSLASLQKHLQSSHPTFQAAKVNTWSVDDKSLFVQEVLRMVNDNRRNPYSKVLRTGSGTRGVVGDAYNEDEKEAIIWTTNLYLGLNRDPNGLARKSRTFFLRPMLHF
ncbi:amino acid adenylation domain-containing protein [Salegentibacter sp. HM20]